MHLLGSLLYSMTNWLVVVMIWTHILKMPGLKTGWVISYPE
jgi:hypothetical protein